MNGRPAEEDWAPEVARQARAVVANASAFLADPSGANDDKLDDALKVSGA